MITLIPPMGILIDIPLGILMWTMVGQFALGIFLRYDSRLALLRIIRLHLLRAALLFADRHITY